MIITKIEPLTSKKCRIELDGETCFCSVQGGSLSFSDLKEGEELTEERQEKI